jgi:hypothetical protein
VRVTLDPETTVFESVTRLDIAGAGAMLSMQPEMVL